VIAAYRQITGMPDTIGGLAGATSDRTVAYALVDGRPVIGVSSRSSGYTDADDAAAKTMRAKLVALYPDVMATGNVGNMPNNGLYHAEANALMRAAEPTGGSLAGRTIDLTGDRRLCGSCEQVLPLVGLQLGNPTVRIIDGTGAVWIMRDGGWAIRGRP
jgi:hypothetical protein